MFVLVIVAVGWGLRRAAGWTPGRRVAARLDLTTSQITTRFVVMVVLGAASIAAVFGFEVILGTFLAGILFGALIRGTERESLFGTRLDAIGFGFFVPIFFIVSGMRLDIRAALTVPGLLSVLGFLAILTIARGAPALLYRGSMSARGVLASGLMLATNVSFVVVAAELGVAGRAAVLVGRLVDGPGRPDLGGAVPGALAVRARRARSRRPRPPDAGSREARRTPVLSSAP